MKDYMKLSLRENPDQIILIDLDSDSTAESQLPLQNDNQLRVESKSLLS